jgi:hypothetical protein
MPIAIYMLVMKEHSRRSIVLRRQHHPSMRTTSDADFIYVRPMAGYVSARLSVCELLGNEEAGQNNGIRVEDAQRQNS